MSFELLGAEYLLAYFAREIAKQPDPAVRFTCGTMAPVTSRTPAHSTKASLSWDPQR
jgi:hypothetical protein